MDLVPRSVPRGAATIATLCVLLLVLLAAAYNAAPGNAQTQPPGGQGPAQAGSSVDEAIIFRQSLGLRTDRQYVQQLQTDPTASRELGIATTSQELAAVRAEQDRATALLKELMPKLEADPTFGGAWFEFPTATLAVATTDPPAHFDGLLGQYAQFGVRFRTVAATYSHSELATLQSRVIADNDRWAAAGVEIASVGIDVKANRLEVGVVNLTAADSLSLAAAYGPRVTVATSSGVKAGTCNSRSDCAAPIKGGLAINDAYFTSCTSGFVFRDIPYAGAWYVSTAGHCINYNGNGVSWLHNGTAFGTASSYVFYSGANVDNGFIVLPAVASPGNQVFASSTSDVRSMTSWYLNSQQIVGLTACRAGRSSGYTCGSIDGTDFDVYENGILIHHMWRVDYASALGDSGGSVLFGNSGIGVFDSYSGSPAKSFYSTLEWIYDTQGKTICTSSSC